MKKIKKILIVGCASVLGLLFIGLIVTAVFLNGIVKKGVETVGPQITKVPIALNSVHIGLLTGSAKVKGLVVGNPPGYKTTQAISVGLAEVGVNAMSVLSDKIVVRTVHVEGAEITFEGNPLGKNNLTDIMDNVNAVARSGGPVNTNAPARQEAKPAKKIQVDDFLISGAKVHVSLTGMVGKETTLSLPDIHLTNLGQGQNGITPTDLTRAVLNAITSATLKVVASDATNVGKEAGKAVGTGVNKVTKGIGDLFKK